MTQNVKYFDAISMKFLRMRIATECKVYRFEFREIFTPHGITPCGLCARYSQRSPHKAQTTDFRCTLPELLAGGAPAIPSGTALSTSERSLCKIADKLAIVGARAPPEI